MFKFDDPSSPNSRIFHLCSWTPILKEPPQTAADTHVCGLGYTERAGSSWLPGREETWGCQCPGDFSPFPSRLISRAEGLLSFWISLLHE